MLQDRVIVVTGAGRGIGAGIARLAGREGASVVVNDLGAAVDGEGADTTPASKVVAEIVEAGGQAVVNGSDVSDHDSAGELIAQAIDTFGRLDVLINVAGILRDKMIFNLDPDDWDAVVNVHLTGTFNTIRHASAYWRGLRDETAHHRIINFTSVSGLHGAPGQLASNRRARLVEYAMAVRMITRDDLALLDLPSTESEAEPEAEVDGDD